MGMKGASSDLCTNNQRLGRNENILGYWGWSVRALIHHPLLGISECPPNSGITLGNEIIMDSSYHKLTVIELLPQVERRFKQKFGSHL